jgi:hypothetical protein
MEPESSLSKRHAEYLARAAEAERQAERASDTQVRQSFRTIAESYRELVSYLQRRVKRGS